MKQFSVTFTRWNEPAIEAGQSDDFGFVIDNVSLRDAIQLGLEYRDPSWSGSCEASCSDHSQARWLSFYNWNNGTREYFETGIIEERELHIPDTVTASSRKRIARLFHTL